MNTEVAKAVAMEGGISILATLARSPNRWVAEEAAGGLWNLSVGEEHKVTICLHFCYQQECVLRRPFQLIWLRKGSMVTDSECDSSPLRG